MRLAAAAGMSCTAIVLRVDRAFVPDDVHVTVTGIDEAHPLRVDVRRAAGIVAFVRRDGPAVTVIRLGPGCVCQPVVPPGVHTLDWTYRSDSPWVFSFACQKLAGRVWEFRSSSSNRAVASVVPENPDAGVARNVPAQRSSRPR